MPDSEKGLERAVTSLLELKSTSNMSDEHFLIMLGMINLMEILNLLERRVPATQKGEGGRRPFSPADAAPFIGLFGGPKFKQQNES
ncbi:hypothetical protein SAMN05660649_03438 [Desulfotomaculum arcticum]|uniref:Uncharacterized protein n=1 Tax=Desulfotruncus arcticus DSM 17038 TaxID=1121424 RepID=A0A1I2WF93_9FIRM|nr:hypothetical protein [Desulfotruncus arcticus]SFG99327.1 hypothetical protein SAMN05660649_03438 [Desulfotomaculum arcticum] [Desulfotruncus arcticus DSM 17038]